MGRSDLHRIGLYLAVTLGSACRGSGTVVAGPRDISAVPQEIAFLGPVPVSGPRRELCLEFDPPGQSLKAASLQAVLIAVDGRRDTLLSPEVDRRGESRVCLVAMSPRAELQAQLQGTYYRGVELVSNTPPVHLKSIHWWSGR